MNNRMNILVVDSDQELLAALEKAFETSGFGTESATSGAEALEKADSSSFEMAIIDADLGDMSGVELIRRFVKSQPQIVSALMAAGGSLREGLDALEAGAVRYFFKPFDGVSTVPRMLREVSEERDQRLRRLHSLSIADGESESRPKIRVLLAEPNEEVRKILIKRLESEDCLITDALIGQEALVHLGEKPFDVLVAAHDMGDMMANDLIARARRLLPELAVVVTTAEPTLQMLATLIRLGADDFIPNVLEEEDRSIEAILRHGSASRVRSGAETIDELVEKAAKYTIPPPPSEDEGNDEDDKEVDSIPKTSSQAERTRAATIFEDGSRALKEKRYDDALQAWQDAVDLHPTNRWYRWNLRKLERIVAKENDQD